MAKRTSPEELQGFSAELTSLLASKGVTQTQLAEGVGATQSVVSTWVNGTYRPAPPMVSDIEVFLGVRPGTLTRHFGFLPLTFDQSTPSPVPDAIAADPDLTDEQGAAMIALYEHYTGTHTAPPRRLRTKK